MGRVDQPDPNPWEEPLRSSEEYRDIFEFIERQPHDPITVGLEGLSVRIEMYKRESAEGDYAFALQCVEEAKERYEQLNAQSSGASWSAEQVARLTKLKRQLDGL